MKDEKICMLDPGVLLGLVEMRMPFGRYRGRPLNDLSGPYAIWFSRKGFPKGHLGDLLRMFYEIKANGLEYLFKPLKK